VALWWQKTEQHSPPFSLQGKCSENLLLSRNCDGWKSRHVDSTTVQQRTGRRAVNTLSQETLG